MTLRDAGFNRREDPARTAGILCRVKALKKADTARPQSDLMAAIAGWNFGSIFNTRQEGIHFTAAMREFPPLLFRALSPKGKHPLKDEIDDLVTPPMEAMKSANTALITNDRLRQH